MSILTSLDRVKKAINLQQPDVIPVAPYMGNYGARLGGVPISVYCRDGEKMAEAQLEAWKKLGQDMVVAQSDNYYIAEGFGITVDFHHDSTPTLKKPVIDNLQDILKLKVPDPLTDGRMPVYLKAISILAKKLGDKVAVRGTGTGPFSLAGHLMGTERFLLELAFAQQEPDGENAKLLRLLMDMTTEALIRFAKAEFDAGAHIVQAGDSLASTDVISPKMYQEWAFPYEQRFFAEIKDYAKKYDGAGILHICGDTTKVLPLMAATGAPILEIDYKVNLKEAKELVGAKVCLLGNLHPTQVLLRGNPELIADQAKQCIADAGAKGGFMLGSGCEVAVDTPLKNMIAMVEAGRAYYY
ncbi:MAG: uroporphyrinogen decarboxylase family protein [Bacillota bacterium]|nr:uroporphyrinogen decarboxylase family protein [Bacillota bacterium]